MRRYRASDVDPHRGDAEFTIWRMIPRERVRIYPRNGLISQLCDEDLAAACHTPSSAVYVWTRRYDMKCHLHR